MGSQSIIGRLKRLEEKSLTTYGVGLLELREDGTWELLVSLSNGRTERSAHPTMEAGRAAFMRKHKGGGAVLGLSSYQAPP